MKIIKPISITPRSDPGQEFLLVPDDPLHVTEGQYLVSSFSSNVPEDDYPVWVDGTYSQGERRIYEHRIYEVLAASTTDNPAEGARASPPTWLDLGATNRWRMFDDKVGTLTTNEGSIEVRLVPGEVVNSIAMLNLQGRLVNIRIIDPADGIVYDCDVPLADTGAADWYEYFFSPIPRRSDFVLADMPAYGAAAIVVTVDAGSEVAAVGHMVLGRLADLGIALYGTSVGIIDYSRKSTDEYGNTIFLERDYSKRAEFDVAIDTSRVSQVQRTLAAVRATPVVWIGEESYEATILYGYYRDFSISISGPSVSDATITVEGLI